MRKKWLLPLHIGIIPAIVLGCIDALFSIRSNDYFGYQLYYTGFSILARNIDYYALVFISTLYLLWIGYLVTGLLKGRVRMAARVIALPAILVGCIHLFNCVDYLKMGRSEIAKFLVSTVMEIVGSLREAVSLTFLKDMISYGPLQMVLAVVVIFVGALLLLFMVRRRTPVQNEPDKQAGASEPHPSRPRRGIPEFRFLTPVFIIVILALNLALGGFWVRNEITLRSKPNVVLIIIDTLRADHIGCYGYSRDTTPNIDKLAANSIRFRRVVSQASWTSPSIGSSLTSRYPETLVQGSGGEFLQEKFLTLGEVLKERGYATSAVVSNNFLLRKCMFSQGYDFYDDSAVEMRITSPKVHSIAQRQLSKLSNRKFFLTLHFMDPHATYVLHPQYNFYPQYQGKLPDRVKCDGFDYVPGIKTPDDLKHVLSLYDSEIRFTDEYIGRILQELKDRKLYDNSLIVILGDHGEEFLDHGKFLHGTTVYEEVLNVPCIIKLPYQHKGVVVNGVFQPIDLMPSVLEALGINVRGFPLHGHALGLHDLRVLKNRYLFGFTDAFAPLRSAEMTPYFRSVEMTPYKYIMDLSTSKEMLFNILEDPGEKKNIIKEEPKVYKELKRVALEHKTYTDAIRDAIK